MVQMQMDLEEMKNESATTRYFCDELEQDLSIEVDTNNKKHIEAIDINESIPLIVQQISNDIIGRNAWFQSPFGKKLICYADYTASGKSLHSIENYIQQQVLPFYGNTHTTTSITGLQTTCFRHEARQIIAQSVNAKITGRGAEDCVLFTGQGATSAVQKVISILRLENTSQTKNNNNQRVVVFTGPFAHHSNLLPWRESIAEVVNIPENMNGEIDTEELTRKLILYRDYHLKIGAFTAASNITGVLVDVDHVTGILHEHGALAIWDYASCAPYVKVDMNPIQVVKNTIENGMMTPKVQNIQKDVVFFSGHKFLGGPNSPGVLVIKKKLLNNAVPCAPGGGTVFFVTEHDHRYLSNRIEREEGGTPDIVGSIRLGLAMELKQRVGWKNILSMEEANVLKVRTALMRIPNLVLLGRSSVQQLPIFSFLIRFEDRFLHYNFVCALLNDLFGIQTRGGCQCAGPYAARLLGISNDNLLELESACLDKQELLRPGFSRFSVPYFMTQNDIDYLLAALEFVASHGWLFLPQYKFNHKSGAWSHRSRFSKFPNRKWLSHFSFNLTSNSTNESIEQQQFHEVNTTEQFKQHQDENLMLAKDLALKCWDLGMSDTNGSIVSGEVLRDPFEKLRWFAYPTAAVDAIRQGQVPEISERIYGPCQPHRYILEAHTKNKSDASPQRNVTKQDMEIFTPNESIARENELQVCNASNSNRESGGKYPLRSSSMDLNLNSKNAQTKSSQLPRVCKIKPPIVPPRTENGQSVKVPTLFPTPPKKVMRLVGQALIQWDMIQDGDRLLLGVSGGKDSLSLLHILLRFKQRAPISFDLACATVDPQTPSFDPSPLKKYMEALKVPYYYLSENIIERAKCELEGDSLCAYCSRMKRGILYTCCRQNKYNKLVLAQHLDDLAESFLMSGLHNGQLRTMKAKYWNNENDIEILRPLVYVREKELKKFAYDAQLPIINENCPACFEEPKERHRVKKLLAQEESLCPDIFNSLKRALLPLMDNSVYETLHAVRDRIETTKRKQHTGGKSAPKKYLVDQ